MRRCTEVRSRGIPLALNRSAGSLSRHALASLSRPSTAAVLGSGMAAKTPGSSAGASSSGKKQHPLSKERLKNVFENTSDLNHLCYYLHIPDDKRNVASAVEYYSESTHPMKARNMIFWLDNNRDTSLADSVMDCAEPPADPSLNPHNLIPVFRAITGRLDEIDDHLVVPDARAELFRKKFSDRDQLTEATGTYYALYHRDPNWKVLSRYLYRAGETMAVQIARPNIQTVTDPSLTPANILRVTHDIPLWKSWDSYICLGMPESQHDEIARRLDGEQAKLELFTTWLASHPCPTWEDVMVLLRWLESEGRGREGAADEMEETYLKMTPEKARQILDASLQDGSMPFGYLKAIAVGVARSGKTLSKKHIFKMKYDPNCSASTGVCEAPIFAFRQISWEMIQSCKKGAYDRLTYKNINQILAKKLRDGLLRGRVAEVALDIVKNASSGSSSSVPSEGVDESGVATPSGDSAASKAVVSAFCEASRAKEEELFKLQVILFLDSGGQPQFHEFLPALSHKVGLVLVFVKLNERLDAPCKNGLTDKEGEWFEEHCPSLLTNEQMLVQFVHTMMCKPLAHSEGVRTMYMVIGTHRDLIDECDETLAQKNERLESLLLPILDEEQLIMNGDSIIFDVNAKNPDETDEGCFNLIREKVSDLSVALHVNSPMCFLIFLNDVTKYAEEKGRRVVSMEECRAIAGRLKMDRQCLEAALIHFNEMSMFMYVPSVLPDRVFIDPQMPLDSANEIVQYSYRVGAGKIPGLTRSECRLWKEGVVTREMLVGKEFSSCFIIGVFEADDALKLFCSLYTAAPLNESEFIMPAMLQTVSWHDMKQHLPAPSRHVAPLLLHFHKSRIANGAFCSTHTCMRSKYGWATSLTKKRVPACLFRNAVKLQHEEGMEIVFIHALKYFAVYLDNVPQAKLASVCPQVRDMLLDAVDSAATAFRFKNSRATVAFQCPCSPEDSPHTDTHTATPEKASDLRCTLSNRVVRDGLTAAQKVWLGPRTDLQSSSDSPSASQTTLTTTDSTPSTVASTGSGQTTPTTVTTTPSRMDERPTLPELLRLQVPERVGTSYSSFGVFLLNDEMGSRVDSIEDHCRGNPEKTTRKILQEWLQGNGLAVTWESLVKTLRDTKLSTIADEIQRHLLS